MNIFILIKSVYGRLVDRISKSDAYFLTLFNRITKLTTVFRLSKSERFALFRSLARMTGDPANLQIHFALSELQKLEIKNGYKSKKWFIYQDIIEQIEDKSDFGTAISKYIPQQDSIIISASEQNDITAGLNAVIELNKKTALMKKAFVTALTYPLILTAAIVLILYFFSVKIIPPIKDALPSDVNLSSNSMLLINISDNFYIWFTLLLLLLGGVIFFLIWAIPNMTGKFRSYLEGIPPFNMYKLVVGCSFLFSISSLARAGYMHLEALQILSTHSNKYLKSRIDVLLDKLADGYDVGQALIQSDMDFPDKKILTELAIQIEYSEDEDTLEVIANMMADDGMEKVQRQAQLLKIIFMMLVGMVVLFLYISIYGLTGEISAS